MPARKPTFLTRDQLCYELQIAPSTLTRLRAEGVVPTIRVRTMVRFDLDEVKAALRRSGNEIGLRRIQRKFIKSGGPRVGPGHTQRLKGKSEKFTRTLVGDSIEEALGLPASSKDD